MHPSWTVKSADGKHVSGYSLGGEGEAVLIAHATGFCGLAYRLLARHLSTRFRVLTFDFRAHGRSDSASGIDLAWDRMTDDVLAVLDRTGMPVHGFGHSMGGAALLMAATRRPEAFSSLFLFEPIVFMDSPPPDNQLRMSSIARRRRSHFGSRAEALARYAANPPFERVLAGCLSDYVQHGLRDRPNGGVELACSPAHEAQIFEYGLTSTLANIGDVRAPTMVAAGNDDAEGPAHLAAPLAAALSNATLTRYEHVDHLGPFQDPLTIARDVVAHASSAAGPDRDRCRRS